MSGFDIENDPLRAAADREDRSCRPSPRRRRA